MKKRILVFPCGSEIALEIHRALKESRHFELIGASSVADHGQFVYENYIGGLPMVNDPAFIPAIAALVQKEHIDAIYPAMDSVISATKENEPLLGALVIAPPPKTTAVCLSKSATYKALSAVVKCPKIIDINKDVSFPIFAKPDIGYGSRGAQKIENEAALSAIKALNKPYIFSEYLSGPEYTVDCFTDKEGRLLVAKGRRRRRIMNGISVNTVPATERNQEFLAMARAINGALTMRGAWFFQLKEDSAGELTLLEVASRLGGSSGLFRAIGLNFALMTLFDAFGYPLSVLTNSGYDIELDRALDNRYRLSLKYNEIYVDFDDCLYLEEKRLNTALLTLLFKGLNERKKLILLSRHKGGVLKEKLKELRLSELFDEVHQLEKAEKKSAYIKNKEAIFIDDSFAERLEVAQNAHIPVFGPDMIDCLL